MMPRRVIEMEMIQRKTESKTDDISTSNMQISINNYGHLAIRYFNNHHDTCKWCNQGIAKDPSTNAYYHLDALAGKWEIKCHPEDPVSRIAELDNTENDMLIVFTKDETNRIRQFLKSLGD